MTEEPLSRESILQGSMRKLAESRPGLIRLMSDAERADWIEKSLAAAPSLDQVWVFAYGSLIWNPAFYWADKVSCSVGGFHRSFCFWTRLGRGCEENPGLMLGLEPGGHCTGVAYRIEAGQLQSEMDILFRRELMSYAYIPTWVDATAEDKVGEWPDGRFKALTFVMDPGHERYCGNLDRTVAIRHLATASGPLGRNCDYLFSLVENLQALGFEDPDLETLATQVKAYQRAHPESATAQPPG